MARILSVSAYLQVAYGRIDYIVFGVYLQKLFPTDIKAFSRIDKAAILQSLQVSFYGLVVYFPSGTGHRICDLLDREQAADVGKQVFDNAFQHLYIGNVKSSYYILQNNRTIKARQVFRYILLPATELHCIRKGTVRDIPLVDFLQAVIGRQPAGPVIFLEGQGQHLQLHIAARQQGSQLPRHKVSVGAGDVDIGVFLDE